MIKRKQMGMLVVAALACLMLSPAVSGAEELTVRRAASIAITAPSASVTEWRGFVGFDGRLFRADVTASTERDAYLEAKRVCERAIKKTCQIDNGHALAWPDDVNAFVSAQKCEVGGRFGTFVGASEVDEGGARYKALEKAKKQGFPASSCSGYYVVTDEEHG